MIAMIFALPPHFSQLSISMRMAAPLRRTLIVEPTSWNKFLAGVGQPTAEHLSAH